MLHGTRGPTEGAFYSVFLAEESYSRTGMWQVIVLIRLIGFFFLAAHKLRSVIFQRQSKGVIVWRQATTTGCIISFPASLVSEGLQISLAEGFQWRSFDARQHQQQVAVVAAEHRSKASGKQRHPQF